MQKENKKTKHNQEIDCTICSCANHEEDNTCSLSKICVDCSCNQEDVTDKDLTICKNYECNTKKED